MTHTTLEHLRTLADRAGLHVSDDVLLRLAPGVDRLRGHADSLRALLSDLEEPANAFSLMPGNAGQE